MTRRKTLPIASAAALLLGVSIAGAQDTDSDGVDNCVLIANPSQHNSDGDAFGNRCDGDFDGSGLVGLRDFLVHRKSMQMPIPPADPDADHEEPPDAFVGHSEVGIFPTFWGLPPGP